VLPRGSERGKGKMILLVAHGPKRGDHRRGEKKREVSTFLSHTHKTSKRGGGRKEEDRRKRRKKRGEKYSLQS